MDGTNWGKFGDRRFAGFAVLGWGGYWPHSSVFLVCKLLNLWNSWSMRRCQIMVQFESGKTSFFKCQKKETLMHKINSK